MSHNNRKCYDQVGVQERNKLRHSAALAQPSTNNACSKKRKKLGEIVPPIRVPRPGSAVSTRQEVSYRATQRSNSCIDLQLSKPKYRIGLSPITYAQNRRANIILRDIQQKVGNNTKSKASAVAAPEESSMSSVVESLHEKKKRENFEDECSVLLAKSRALINGDRPISRAWDRPNSRNPGVKLDGSKDFPEGGPGGTRATTSGSSGAGLGCGGGESKFLERANARLRISNRIQNLKKHPSLLRELEERVEKLLEEQTEKRKRAHCFVTVSSTYLARSHYWNLATSPEKSDLPPIEHMRAVRNHELTAVPETSIHMHDGYDGTNVDGEWGVMEGCSYDRDYEPDIFSDDDDDAECYFDADAKLDSSRGYSNTTREPISAPAVVNDSRSSVNGDSGREIDLLGDDHEGEGDNPDRPTRSRTASRKPLQSGTLYPEDNQGTILDDDDDDDDEAYLPILASRSGTRTVSSLSRRRGAAIDMSLMRRGENISPSKSNGDRIDFGIAQSGLIRVRRDFNKEHRQRMAMLSPERYQYIKTCINKDRFEEHKNRLELAKHTREEHRRAFEKRHEKLFFSGLRQERDAGYEEYCMRYWSKYYMRWLFLACSGSRLHVMAESLRLDRSTRYERHRRNTAAELIQRSWRSYSYRTYHAKHAMALTVFRRHLWFYVMSWRIKRKTRAVGVILDFFHFTLQVQNISKIISRYLFSVRRIQKWWRKQLLWIKTHAGNIYLQCAQLQLLDHTLFKPGEKLVRTKEYRRRKKTKKQSTDKIKVAERANGEENSEAGNNGEKLFNAGTSSEDETKKPDKQKKKKKKKRVRNRPSRKK
eukprot:Rmarinus@m.28917